MDLKVFLGVLVCCSFAIVSAELENCKVYDVYAKSQSDQLVITEIGKNGKLDFFDRPRALNVASRIMVPPNEQEKFEKTLDQSGIEFKVVDDNLAKSIDEERLQNKKFRAISRGISFSAFQRMDQINSYLDELAMRFPDRVRVNIAGKTYEGRPMKTITISNGDNKPNKKVIWLDAGIHAREWIAPAGALYVINQLVENFAANKNLLNGYEWVIMPVVNPDGYEYTHTTSRMWRKTRKPSGNSCFGTDPNRNFGYHWGEIGASNLPCDDTYRGPTAFSEPETQVLRNQLLALGSRCKFYLTLHAYGNYLLYPWGWTSGLPSNVADIDEVARAGAAAIKAGSGNRYTVGSSTNVLYEAAGGSDDWALGVAKIPISITMELPAGGSGFNPPPSYILPMVAETWIGIKAMAEKVISKY